MSARQKKPKPSLKNNFSGQSNQNSHYPLTLEFRDNTMCENFLVNSQEHLYNTKFLFKQPQENPQHSNTECENITPQNFPFLASPGKYHIWY